MRLSQTRQVCIASLDTTRPTTNRNDRPRRVELESSLAMNHRNWAYVMLCVRTPVRHPGASVTVSPPVILHRPSPHTPASPIHPSIYLSIFLSIYLSLSLSLSLSVCLCIYLSIYLSIQATLMLDTIASSASLQRTHMWVREIRLQTYLILRSHHFVVRTSVVT